MFPRGLFLLPVLAIGGCILSKPSLTPMATKIDPKEAQPDFWWNKPGVASVSHRDFEKLWAACKFEMYVRLFVLDREEYRQGLLTSEPLVSKQIFEPWRPDVVSLHDQVESTLGTIRRTVHIQVTRQPDGTFTATPKVLIERYTSEERRLTSFTQYHSAFGGPRTTDITPDQGEHQATDFWYPLRRDRDLEKIMAGDIRYQLGE